MRGSLVAGRMGSIDGLFEMNFRMNSHEECLFWPSMLRNARPIESASQRKQILMMQYSHV